MKYIFTAEMLRNCFVLLLFEIYLTTYRLNLGIILENLIPLNVL